jgi:hypothetical protein
MSLLNKLDEYTIIKIFEMAHKMNYKIILNELLNESYPIRNYIDYYIDYYGSNKMFDYYFMKTSPKYMLSIAKYII